MKSAFPKTIAPTLLATAALAVVALTGCGGSSPSPAPKVEGASNVYAIQYATVDSDSVYQCAVLTFPVTASGASATPSATLTLPAGFDAYSLAVGPTGKLYVGGSYYQGGAPSQIYVYAAGATGSAQPLSVFTGGTPGTFDYPDFMTVNSSGQLFIMDDEYQIVGFDPTAQSGDLPQQYITTYITEDTFSYGIGSDAEGNLYLANEETGNIDVFGPGATGAAVPVRSFTNGTSSFGRLSAITASPAGVVTVANYNASQDPFADVMATRLLQHQNLPPHLRQRLEARIASGQHHANTLPAADTGIYVFAAGATGATTPTVSLSGSATGIVEPANLATDAVGNIYLSDFDGGYYSNVLPKVMVFSAGATGNVAPSTSFSSTGFVDNWEDIIGVF